MYTSSTYLVQKINKDKQRSILKSNTNYKSYKVGFNNSMTLKCRTSYFTFGSLIQICYLTRRSSLMYL